MYERLLLIPSNHYNSHDKNQKKTDKSQVKKV